MKRTGLTRIGLAVVLGGAIGLAGHAEASLVPFSFSEGFESVSVGDAMPAGWIEQPNTDFDVAAPVWHSSQAAQLIDGSAQPDTMPFTGVSTEGIGADKWLDFDLITADLGTGNWLDTTSLWWGLGARVQPDGSMYGFRIQGSSSGAIIRLIHINSSGGITTYGSSSATGTIDSNEIVSIEFSVVNDDITQEINLFAKMVTNDGNTKTTSHSVPYTHGTAIMDPGGIALIASDNASGSRQFTWDNININGKAVPEPASMALMGLGALLFARRNRA